MLLDVLVAYTPTFEKLRNPLLRRTIGRMATLAQAARMGNVDLGDLLHTLRAAANEDVLVAPGDASAMEALSAARPEPPRWLDEAKISVRLDVRPLQARGESPLPAIMSAARDVAQGEILYLRNTFEPLPLYEALGKKGFQAWARSVEGQVDDWQIYFYRATLDLQAEDSLESASEPLQATGAPPVASVTIDVTDLTPPQPMMRVLEALAQMAPGETLLVRHVQRPMYLYSKLDEMGHAHQTWEMGTNHVEILIRVGESS